jgi:hypothetical protein
MIAFALILLFAPIRVLRRLWVRITRQTPRSLWVKALRSGKYKQGQQALRSGDLYCCLGVACEVYRKLYPLKRRKADGSVIYSYDKEVGTLPLKVAQWLDIGISGRFEDVRTEYQCRLSGSLVGCNDAFGLTFDEIANIIENDGYRGRRLLRFGQ